jgi:acyl carrier protein
MTHEDVRGFIASHLSEQQQMQGRAFSPNDVSDDLDLLLSGLIDSLGLLELMVALSGFAGTELDFEGLDPDAMTIVGPLCDFVVGQVQSGARG